MIHSVLLTASWLSLVAATAAQARPPEICHVHPDYPTAGPRVVTGEGNEAAAAA